MFHINWRIQYKCLNNNNKENNFQKNRFLGLVNIHLDLFHRFSTTSTSQDKQVPEFGGHLGKMANRKKCSTFGVWLQTDLDSAAQNLMETIIKVYICLKTKFSYQRLGSFCKYFVLFIYCLKNFILSFQFMNKCL